MLRDYEGGYLGVCWDDANDRDGLTAAEVKQALAGVYAGLEKKLMF